MVREESNMAITIDFAKKYAHLIPTGLPKVQLESYTHNNQVPKKYRKKFVHQEDGFVQKFCEDYGDREEPK